MSEALEAGVPETSSPPARQATATPKDEAHRFERLLLEGPASVGYSTAEIAGAARHHGWKNGTTLTLKELTDGVKKFLASPISDTPEA